MQLAVADIDGDDRGGTARQKDLGEAAGRCARIEAGSTARVDPEDVERMGELHAPARHPGMRGLRRDLGPDRNFLRGLAHESAVGGDATGRHGVLRLRAAFEEAAFDEQAIGAQALGHRRELRRAEGMNRVLDQSCTSSDRSAHEKAPGTKAGRQVGRSLRQPGRRGKVQAASARASFSAASLAASTTSGAAAVGATRTVRRSVKPKNLKIHSR